MKNAGKTIKQIISEALIGKTILKIDNDQTLLGRRISDAQYKHIIVGGLGSNSLIGVEITVAPKGMNPKESRFLPFDQDTKLVLRD